MQDAKAEFLLVCDVLRQQITNEIKPEAVADKDAIETARTFVALRTMKDTLDAMVKEFNAIYEEYKGVRLPKVFEDAGVPTINLDEGYRVTVAHSVRASIRGGKKEEAYQWLKDNKLGDLITDTVNSSTLSAAAKAMQEDNYELDPEIFNVHILPITSVTKTR